MNIVFDSGLRLDDAYRDALAPLLPVGNAPLLLDESTGKTDGTPNLDEGFVFLTHLPVDVLKYHTLFFDSYREAPQWFFILINKNDHGISDLRNAARKYSLKNPSLLYAGDLEAFETAVSKIASANHIIRGKVLYLSKHKKSWLSDLAQIMFDDDRKYEIMDSTNTTDSDSEALLLCGEGITDFKGLSIPGSMEPYFVFRFKSELQHFINPAELVSELAKSYHMTTERVESRLFFVDVESERWLVDTGKVTGDDAAKAGILLWNRFGLPISRMEYTQTNIKAGACRSHADIERLKELIQ